MYYEEISLLSLFSEEQLWASNGLAKTNSLFSETARQGDTPIMSLNGGNKNLICLRDLYVPLVANDPSEVEFAEYVFGDLRYWLKLKSAVFMPKYLEEWSQLADVKRKQKAFAAIIREINENGRSAFTAAKYLIEEPWKPTTKKSTNNKIKSADEAKSAFSEDIDRLEQQGLLQ